MWGSRRPSPSSSTWTWPTWCSILAPMYHPMIVWVHDTITILATTGDRPIQGFLVDQRTYF